MIKREFVFQGKEGFHVRPASQFAKLVKSALSSVTLVFDGEEYDGKSPLSIMSACIEDGAEFALHISGDDEEAVLVSVEDVMVCGAERYFMTVCKETGGHDKVSAGEASAEETSDADTGCPAEETSDADDSCPADTSDADDSCPADTDHNAYTGVAASDGVAIGPAYVFAGTKPAAVFMQTHDIKKEEERLLDAVSSLQCDLQSLCDSSKGEGADIAQAHIDLLSDESFVARIKEVVRTSECCAEYAVLTALQGFETEFAGLKNERIRQRIADITDISYGLHGKLTGTGRGVSFIPPDSIVVAQDILPSDMLRILPYNPAAFLLEGGGVSSHAAIVAKSMALPAIVGAEGVLSKVKSGCTIALDGKKGRYWIDPDAAETNAIKRQIADDAADRESLRAYINIATKTINGIEVKLLANVFSTDDMEAAVEQGAQGVGLFRTEFMYMNREMPPSCEEQFAIYKRVMELADGRPVTFRTLDMGGDKPISCLPSKAEDNPYLGRRGIRYSLGNIPVFTEQLRALLMASIYGDLRIMLPMITVPDEIKRSRLLLCDVSDELKRNGVRTGNYKTGIMIETPSAAIISRHLSGMVDFFSIGSNDLTQYTMAADRSNTDVAAIGSPYSPAVLQLIRMTADAGKAADIEVCVCGESASDPLLVPLYISMGIRSLSMVHGRIAGLRRYINNLDLQKWILERPCLPDLTTADEVRDALK